MNPFLERLPWRIAALAGLLVGGVSLLTGAQPWTCLLRVGAPCSAAAPCRPPLRAGISTKRRPEAARKTLIPRPHPTPVTQTDVKQLYDNPAQHAGPLEPLQEAWRPEIS